MKHCKNCGAELVRRKKESSWNFKYRRFCGRDCATIARTRVVPEKKCKWCGELLERKRVGKKRDRLESAWAFDKREFCDHVCSGGYLAAAAWAKHPKTNCAHCGKIIQRRRVKSGAWECLAHYRRRKYCGRECLAAAQSATAAIVRAQAARSAGYLPAPDLIAKKCEQAVEVAREEGRITGLYVCPICGMRGKCWPCGSRSPHDIETDCIIGVLRHAREGGQR